VLGIGKASLPHHDTQAEKHLNNAFEVTSRRGESSARI